jgi:four helix bundle protein
VRQRDLDDRLLVFGARALRLAGALPRTAAGRHIAGQLLRCSTSIGANYQEAQAAESRGDFIHKLQVSLKEARETHYWLRLIEAAKLLPASRLAGIVNESTQLKAILAKSVASAKGISK